VSKPGTTTPVTVQVTLTPEAMEQIVALAVDRLREKGGAAPTARWLTGAKAAAVYLGCSPKRIYNRLGEIPHVRDGGRLMFNTADLDDHLRNERSTT